MWKTTTAMCVICPVLALLAKADDPAGDQPSRQVSSGQAASGQVASPSPDGKRHVHSDIASKSSPDGSERPADVRELPPGPKTLENVPSRQGHGGRVPWLPDGVREGLGLEFGPMSALLKYHLPDLFADRVGVVITKVRRGSPAERAGLRVGDVVTYRAPPAGIRGLRLADAGRERSLPLRPANRIAFEVLQAGTIRYHQFSLGITRQTHAVREPAALSINAAIGDGAVSLSGTRGNYQLDASFRDPQGIERRVKQRGSLAQIRAAAAALPPALAEVVERQLP